MSSGMDQNAASTPYFLRLLKNVDLNSFPTIGTDLASSLFMTFDCCSIWGLTCSCCSIVFNVPPLLLEVVLSSSNHTSLTLFVLTLVDPSETAPACLVQGSMLIMVGNPRCRLLTNGTFFTNRLHFCESYWAGPVMSVPVGGGKGMQVGVSSMHDLPRPSLSSVLLSMALVECHSTLESLSGTRVLTDGSFH